MADGVIVGSAIVKRMRPTNKIPPWSGTSLSLCGR